MLTVLVVVENYLNKKYIFKSYTDCVSYCLR